MKDVSRVVELFFTSVELLLERTGVHAAREKDMRINMNTA
jgi:hypothetical protein